MSQNPTVILLYSRRHFDPDSEAPLRQSSAGVIASQIYSELKEYQNYQVQYLDSYNLREWIPFKNSRPILLIGILENLHLASRFFKADQVIALLVNCHPWERLLRATKALSSGMERRALISSDGIFEEVKNLECSSAAILFGNQRTLSTYSKWKYKGEIILKGYSPKLDARFKRDPASYIKKQRFNCLFFASDFSYRKGIDRLISLVESDLDKSRDYFFVGEISNTYWIKIFSQKLANFHNVHFMGPLSKNSNEFDLVLKEIDYAVFPSREEGLLGTLLESMELGIPCLYSKECGVDVKHEMQSLENDLNNIDKSLTNFENFISQNGNLERILLSQQEIIGEIRSSSLRFIGQPLSNLNSHLKSSIGVRFSTFKNFWLQIYSMKNRIKIIEFLFWRSVYLFVFKLRKLWFLNKVRQGRT